MIATQQLLDELFLAHRAPLVSTILRIVGCHQTAEDLAQETYVRVCQAARERSIDYLQPFFYQTAKNLALDYLRKEQVRHRVLAFNADDASVSAVPSSAPLPEQVAADDQRQSQLHAVMAGLPERKRRMLVLHKLHGWRYKDIALHFNVSESAVEKNIRSALAYCLAVFTRQGIDL